MEWATIRRHYERLFALAKKGGATQQSIAARGGLRQNKISELLDNDRRGPNAETFVKAVEGLGLTLSSFFAQIEGLQSSAVDGQNDPLANLKGATGDSPVPVPTTEADRDLYRKIGRMFLLAAASERNVAQPARTARPPAKRRGQR